MEDNNRMSLIGKLGLGVIIGGTMVTISFIGFIGAIGSEHRKSMHDELKQRYADVNKDGTISNEEERYFNRIYKGTSTVGGVNGGCSCPVGPRMQEKQLKKEYQNLAKRR